MKYQINNMSNQELEELIEKNRNEPTCEACYEIKECVKCENELFQSILSEGIEEHVLDLINDAETIKMQSAF